MRPRTILHNSVSLDGSVVGLDIDLQTHYRIAGSFAAQANLVGSGTALAGIDLFGLPPETDAQLRRPADDDLPPWVVVDSGARLLGKLHAFRGSELGGDPIVLVAAKTEARYLEHLTARGYRHHVVGDQRVDLAAALALLGERYAVRTLLVDAGPGLAGALFAAGLIDEVSLLVMPALVAREPLRLFDTLQQGLTLELLHEERVAPAGVWLRYRVLRH